ncbi:TonB-linked SusC/RagA family outer membrane protein [Sphingobacterium zeae]|uniref:TonB-linked SusC/RagA family outer membrane protein n=1 Tax=Sphingobacterium zeae TaxID=1776859 RepID=A0ABU0UAG9_9SPHI|nr:SusC/RagA family TonB-linked outer membrane protein [Sphingobacterium zeae]MDQ1151839.1 TonB-linked SusC/RagA family outer membrane protein [Sphingobacterium zeae]
MRYIYIILFLVVAPQVVLAQTYFGRLIGRHGASLPGATIATFPDQRQFKTDSSGYFSFDKKKSEQIRITMVGYAPMSIALGKTRDLGTIQLRYAENQLDEVIVNTGYYTLNKNMLTGSFATVDRKTLTRNPAGNILDRLEGVTSGLQFDRSLSVGENKFPNALRVRGISSIQSSTEPLVILDNFPYEGDINAINPNDIESVTVLKDAAAAAIWGAKAGNGVIVLTSKKGRLGAPLSLSFQNNWQLTQKPDLFYSRQFLPAKDMMEVEEYLYGKGNYYNMESLYIPDYVGLLFKRDANDIAIADFETIKAHMQQQDIRQEAKKLLYRNALSQRYAIQARGGAQQSSYFISGSYDRNPQSIIGNSDQRLTFNIDHDLKIGNRLTVNTYLRYAADKEQQNGYRLQQLTASGSGLSPYVFLQNTDGTPASLNYQFNHAYRDGAESNGLLDWTFNPLVDRNRRDISSFSKQLTLGTGLNYRMGSGFSVNLKYRYQHQAVKQQNLYDADSYFVRNLINQFTQADGTRVVPLGGIKDGQNSEIIGHNGRIQLDYTRQWSMDHQLVALAGAEISQNTLSRDIGYRLYGYHADNGTYLTNIDYSKQYAMRPNGASLIPATPFEERFTVDRFISYFANATYLLNSTHGISGSIRWDASNLFGVKTNQRGVPLWSLGLSEQLLPLLKDHAIWLDKLTLRTTYGYSGNVNNTISAYPSMRISSANLTTGLPYAKLTSAGNPNLRWEKLTTLNVGLDFSVLQQRVSGSVEYYVKSGKDLIGPNYLDPSTGISPEGTSYYIDNRINYANLRTNGVDLTFAVKALQGVVRWDINLLWSMTKNKVTKYMANDAITMAQMVSNAQPRVGYSRDALYAWKFNGISAENGQLITPDGDQNYMKYATNATLDDIIFIGPNFPPYQGSMRHQVAYKNFELSANLEWKNGFYFRRNTIDYFKLFYSGIGHQDYLNRWQTPGDELITTVPAIPAAVDLYRDALYANSELMIEKGDFIRLSDVRLSYQLPMAKKARLNIFGYVRNVGILYRANKVGVDPDAAAAAYPAPRTYTVGFQLEW